MNAGCGTFIQARLDLDSFSSEQIEDANPTGFCMPFVNAISSVCNSLAGKRVVRENVKEILCQAGKQQSLRGPEGTRKWIYTNTDAGHSTNEALEADLKKRLDYYRANALPEATQVNQRCGAEVEVEVDWKTYSAEQVEQVLPISICRPLLKALEGICSDASGKKAVSERIKKIACNHGPTLTLTGPIAGRLVWTSHEAAVGEHTFAKKYLLAHLGSVADERKWEKVNKKMIKIVEKTKKACGVELAYVFDKASFSDADAKNSPEEVCFRPFYAIEDLCRDKSARAKVARKLKSVSCAYKKGEFTVTYLRSELSYRGPAVGPSGWSQAIQSFLLGKWEWR